MKFRKIILLSLLSLMFMNMQCDDDDVVIISCGSEVILDNDAYENAESDNYYLGDVYVDGDCLNIGITSSGCDASTWVMALIDSENIAESLPPQRYLKLSLYNNEACLAVFNKEELFDLIQLRIQGTNEVLLNIDGLDESILYTY